MSNARDEILARIRAANGAAGTSQATGTSEDDAAGDGAAADAGYAVLPRAYLRAHHDPAATDVVALFAERAADYRAVVERVPPEGIPAAIAGALTAGAIRTVLVPDGLPAEWLAGIDAAQRTTLVRDQPPLPPAGLDQVDGVITGCAIAIAETGTVVLDHGPAQGRRALSLVPDFHLVVVRAGQVAADLADAVARLDPSRPLTFISGPSATSDIELIRVEGVHGPRALHVLIAG